MAPRLRLPRPSAAAVGAVVLLGTLAGCGDGGGEAAFVEGRRIDAAEATGLAVTAEGRLVVGERSSGRVVEVDPDTGDQSDIGRIDDVDDQLTQGGLLGLTVLDGGVVAAYTNDEGRLVVADVGSTGVGQVRWQGPEAQEEANGGRLAVLPGDRLIIGVGDLLDPGAASDPDAPNTKVLEIGEDGAVTPVAAGFNNPFALTADGDTIWVADNAPGDDPERLLRVRESEVEEVASWTDTRVPSGIAVLDDGRLALCSFATAELRLVDPEDPGDASGELVADDCLFGVVTLPEGRLAYATDDEVVILRPA